MPVTEIRAGVRISDAQLNAAIGRIASQNRMDLDEFRVALESRGQSYNDMREQVRRELVLQRVQQGNVNQRIQISEQEVENFIATNEGQKLTQPEYHLLHALLPLGSDIDAATEARAEAHVNKLLKRIRDGADFSEVERDGRRMALIRKLVGDLSSERLLPALAEAYPNLDESSQSIARSWMARDR